MEDDSNVKSDNNRVILSGHFGMYSIGLMPKKFRIKRKKKIKPRLLLLLSRFSHVQLCATP